MLFRPCVLALCATAFLMSVWESAFAAVPPGYTAIRSVAGVDEYRLETNGLTVLLKPDQSMPVATFRVVYRVGSRNEVIGTTGATHFLEHLMFRGSKNFSVSSGFAVKQYLDRIGALFNGETNVDGTSYYAMLPQERLLEYIPIEADRMRNLLLRDEDRNAEMTVVRNEYENGENYPETTLRKELRATAFQALPAHHDTIGWRSDIENTTISELREFYDKFYWPDNAAVVVVGAFNPESTLKEIAKSYGSIPPAPKPIPQMDTEEPIQTGPRRVVVHRDGEFGVVSVAHKVPTALDPDMPALKVLDAILGGGKSNRLSRALEDKGLAGRVSVLTQEMRDMSFHTVTAKVSDGIKHESVERALLLELERLRTTPVTEEELVRAKRTLKLEHAKGRLTSAGVAKELASNFAMGDWTLDEVLLGKLDQVTVADVRRVAVKYFDPNLSTTGWFVPEDRK